MRAYNWLEGAPFNFANYPNPSLRAYHRPEGTPFNFAKYPNPSLRANHLQKLEGTPLKLRQDEPNKRHTRERKENERSKGNNKAHENRSSSPAKRQGDT